MTDDELEAIRSRMTDNYFKWHILTAQQDLKRLLAEVERLRGEQPEAAPVTPEAGVWTGCGSRPEGLQPSSCGTRSS